MSQALALDCVAASGRYYPGDTVTLYVRADQAHGYRLRIVLPEGLSLASYRVPEPMVGRVPHTGYGKDVLEWNLSDDLERWELELDVAVLPTVGRLMLATVAQLLPSEVEEVTAEAWATVHVEPKSRYLRYLPALYANDDFMGRFLMLFESFWNPVDTQIGALANYFDPAMTPPQLLGWLGSWLNVDLNGHLPENRQRLLIQRAARLYRQRGTKGGLAAMLELWTGASVAIIEHRSDNLRLGKNMRLGRGVALGRRNAPHSFTVRVCLPNEAGESQAEHLERHERLRPMVEQLIQAEKPAHTTYTIDLGC